MRDHPAKLTHTSKSRFCDRRNVGNGPLTPSDAQHASVVQQRQTRWIRVCFHPPRRPRNRTLGGCFVCSNPIYFDPANIVELAIEGGCNAVATTFGVLGSVSRKYAHRIPFIVKLNHNELLTYPATYDQIMFGSVEQAYDLGAAGVGATIYFGSDESGRQIQETAEAFEKAHQLGMFTVLWCYLRNSEIDTDDQDNHVAADATGQANHIGVTIEADIIKQNSPRTMGHLI